LHNPAELEKLEALTDTLSLWLRDKTRHGSPDTIA